MIRVHPRRTSAFTTAGGGAGAFPASLLIDLDATDATSYTSGQTWANLAASGSTYDFYLGADGSSSSDDPTFTGSAGDSGAYFNHDGGDYFTIAGGNTSFIQDMHKTTGGNDWWVAYACQGVLHTGNQWFYGTESTTSHGISTRSTALEELKGLQRGVSTSGPSYSSVGAWTAADHLLIISHDHGTNNTRVWLDSATSTDAADTYSTSTTNPAQTFKIGCRADVSQFVASGHRTYAFSAGNSYLTDEEAGDIFTLYNDRHGRTYNP